MLAWLLELDELRITETVPEPVAPVTYIPPSESSAIPLSIEWMPILLVGDVELAVLVLPHE